MPSASSELKLERAVNELKQRTLFQRDLDSVEKWAVPPHSQWEKEEFQVFILILGWNSSLQHASRI